VVVGCGAVGSYYGAKLARGGAEVNFLLRSDYDTVQKEGVRIQSVRGDFVVHPRCSRTPEEVGPCDLVLIALKATANDQFPHLLPALVGKDSVLVTLQNGLGNEESLSSLLPDNPIVGALCFVCLNRIAPGHILHLAHGLVVVGEFTPARAGLGAGEISDLFRNADVPSSTTKNLAQARWEKLLWNIPFNGLGVASAAGLESVLSGSVLPGLQLGSCLPTDQLLASPGWYSLVCELMTEVRLGAGRLGLQIPSAFAEELITRTRTMGSYRASTLIDFEQKRPLELNSIFLEPLRRAKLAGQDMPRLDALCRVLQALDQRRGTTPLRA
jgi:2-dehydropantoate 2-reductase